MIPSTVRALIFDVFGTLVDWRSSVARHLQQALTPLGIQANWLALADAWRAQYDPSMAAVREGRLPFCKLDVLHRHNLDVVLREHGWDHHPGLDGPLRERLNLAWHHLDAWPDGDRRSRIVFIARGTDPAAVEVSLGAFNRAARAAR